MQNREEIHQICWNHNGWLIIRQENIFFEQLSFQEVANSAQFLILSAQNWYFISGQWFQNISILLCAVSWSMWLLTEYFLLYMVDLFETHSKREWNEMMIFKPGPTNPNLRKSFRLLDSRAWILSVTQRELAKKIDYSCQVNHNFPSLSGVTFIFFTPMSLQCIAVNNNTISHWTVWIFWSVFKEKRVFKF